MKIRRTPLVAVAPVAGLALSVLFLLPTDASDGVVQRYGRLQIKNGRLCAASGEPVQLRGFSSHDLNRFPFTSATVSNLARGWGISVVRAAMYTDSYGSSYIRDPRVLDTVKLIVDEALRQSIYVIVDWHILQDRNPNTYRIQAREFFEEIARKYGGNPNLLYEICNEPNGPDVTWNEIRNYAGFVIPAIRAIDTNNIIIVGTDTWSQGVLPASFNPLPYTNVMYALHFYAGSHGQALSHNAEVALARGLPIFVTEWGLTDATGRSRIYPEESARWVDWMNSRGISWANWSFSNCDEPSAALKPGASMNGPWTDADLTPSGAWVRKAIGAVH